MAEDFRELRKKMSPETRGRARVLAQKYSEQMPSDELRAARQITHRKRQDPPKVKANTDSA